MSENIKGVEQSLLGSCLQDNEIAQQVISKIDDTYFYSTLAKNLFNTIKEMPKIDMVLLGEKVGNDDRLKVYVLECFDITKQFGGVFWEEYIRLLTEYKIRREIKGLGLKMTLTGEADDIKELLDDASEKINSLRPAEKVDKRKQLDDIIEEFQESMKRGDEMNTGFPTLDKYISGFRRKKLYILGGLPGSGKTALALFLANRMAFTKNMKTLIFSLEMPMSAMVGRLTSIIYEVFAERIQEPWRLKQEDILHITNTCGKIYKSKLELVDGVWSIGDIMQKVKTEKPDFVIIDHLLFIQMKLGKYQKEHEAIASIIKNLIHLVKKENICMLLLTHNRRGTAGSHISESNKDYQGSSAIKQDADVGMMIMRPEENKKETIVSKPAGYARIRIIKNRNTGIEKTVPVLFNADTLRFKEYTGYGGGE